MPAKKKDEANDDAESVTSTSTSSSMKNSRSTRNNRTSLGGAANKSTMLDETTSSKNKLAQEIYDAIRVHRLEDGRLLGDIFLKLPPKRTNPDYYNIVKEPIDLLRVQQKLKSNEYERFQDFDSDIQLLIANSKLFYKVCTLFISF
jgi:protein polybromo-1